MKMMFSPMRIVLPVHLRCLVRCCNSTSTFTEFDYKPKFSSTEQEKILSIINESNTERLLSLNVSQSKIKNLEKYKQKNGSFKSVIQLLEVDGLSVKLMEKLCQQLISSAPIQNSKLNNSNKKVKQMIIPSLPTTKSISSTVGVYLATTGVSWAKIVNSGNHLEYWDCQNFQMLPKKMLPTDTFTLAKAILNNIPTADAYVFEATSNMGLQTPTVKSYAQNLELSSMLLALINTSPRHNLTSADDEQTENMVYFMRSKLPARLFKTLVGQECVSSTETVLQLLDSSSKSSFTLPCTPITFKEQLKSNYIDQSSTHKELLGQALLLVVAFVDLCVRKNATSINAVFPRKNGT